MSLTRVPGLIDILVDIEIILEHLAELLTMVLFNSFQSFAVVLKDGPSGRQGLPQVSL